VGRPCSICGSDRRGHVDADLLAGCSYAVIVDRHGFPKDAVRRHAASHLLESPAVATGDAENVSAELQALLATTRKLLSQATAKGDLRTSTAALRQLSDLLEMKLRQPVKPVKREIKINVHYEKRPPRFTDATLLANLEAYIQRPGVSDAALAAVARLVSIVRKRPLGAVLEREVSAIEAGDPSNSEGPAPGEVEKSFTAREGGQ
jgi:hypothetical protein